MSFPAALPSLSLFLHVGLAALHAVLVYLAAYHVEHNVSMSLGNTSERVSLIIVIGSQVFSTLYAAGMLLVVQQLALQQHLESAEDVTSLHDQTSAWSGLGAATGVLWRQFKLPSSVWSLVVIFIYLSGMSALHITTPALLNVEPYNQTSVVLLNATSSIPTINNLMDTKYVGILETIGTLLPGFLFDNTTTNRIGISQNTLYDVISDTDAVGTANVSAVSLSVTCNPFDLASPTAQYVGDRYHRPWQGYWAVNSSSGPSALFYPAAPGHLRVAQPSGYVPSKNGAGMNLSIMSFVMLGTTLTDSGGTVAKDTFIMPYPTVDNGSLYDANGTTTAYVTTCALTMERHQVNVDLRTKLLLNAPLRREWASWTDTSSSVDPDPMADWLSSLWSFTTASTVPTAAVDCFPLTVMEQYLAQSLGLISPVFTRNSIQQQWTTVPRSNVELLDLERTIEDLVSLLIWSVPSTTSIFRQNATQIEGTAVVLQARLNLNMLPVIAGTAIAFTLLSVNALLTWESWKGRKTHPWMLDSMGVLQLLWLSGCHPSASIQLAGDVKKPTLKRLRQVGSGLSLWPTLWHSDHASEKETTALRGGGPIHLLSSFESGSLVQ